MEVGGGNQNAKCRDGTPGENSMGGSKIKLDGFLINGNGNGGNHSQHCKIRIDRSGDHEILYIEHSVLSISL